MINPNDNNANTQADNILMQRNFEVLEADYEVLYDELSRCMTFLFQMPDVILDNRYSLYARLYAIFEQVHSPYDDAA